MAKKPIKYSVIDAFTNEEFKGNPAAVCLLEEERDEEWLQAVAREFNISQTCYLTRLTDSADGLANTPKFSLRWFTPVAEVKLCGHATLAASHFLFSYGLVNSDVIAYSTLSGILTAKKVPDIEVSDSSSVQNRNIPETFLIELDFPAVPIIEQNGEADIPAVSKSLSDAHVLDVKKTKGDDLLVVLPSGNSVAAVQPKFDEIEKFPGRGMIITGPAPDGSRFDFFSRFFCPRLGIDEDPVCGSAHCALAHYWSKRLGKCDFIAYQASPRSGVLNLHLDEKNERVLLRGKAIAVMEGSLLV